jgi:hypothetical protein
MDGHRQSAIHHQVMKDRLTHMRLGVLNKQQQGEVATHEWYLELHRLARVRLTDRECQSMMTHYPGNPYLVPNTQYGEQSGMVYTDPKVQIHKRHTEL